MDILGVCVWLLILTLFLASLVAYTWHMSKDLNIFERISVSGPPPTPLLGNLGFGYWWDGVCKSQVKLYRQFQDKKFYGTFDANVPVLHIKDPDMIHDVLVTQFDQFVGRPSQYKGDRFLDRCLHFLEGDHWRRTRQMVSAALDPSSLRSMTSVVQRTSDSLFTFLKPKIDWRRRVELSDLALHLTVDVHTGIVFGGNYKTFERLETKNTIYTEKLLHKSKMWRITSTFLPFMSRFWSICGVSAVPKRALKFYNKRMDEALQKTLNANSSNGGRRQWIYNLLVANAEIHLTDKPTGMKQLVPDSKQFLFDCQTLGFTFIHSGLEKVSNVLSLTLFLLANHPDCCQTVQQEIDDNIGANSPDESNIQHLPYLDQCIYESMRMFPRHMSIERTCTKETSVHGVRVPANMVLRIPVYALHHDPNVWSDPDKFRPERFDERRKSTRHPCTFLPFGFGPRNCPGKHFALVELKIALVYILRLVTPFPCPQTIYPIKLCKWKMVPEHELWVKFRPRFWSL